MCFLPPRMDFKSAYTFAPQPFGDLFGRGIAEQLTDNQSENAAQALA
jgi:hypothetical protein